MLLPSHPVYSTVYFVKFAHEILTKFILFFFFHSLVIIYLQKMGVIFVKIGALFPFEKLFLQEIKPCFVNPKSTWLREVISKLFAFLVF